MDRKNRIGIFIFTLGVFLFLLRPFLIYQATSIDNYKANPAHTSSLLLRQIKKKDDNHDQLADVAVIRMLTEKIVTSSFGGILHPITQVPAIYHTPWYQLISHHCFQPGAP
ncbi:hypothetical protein HDE69_000371 [Pedobacter cryoconitis]|uniref:Uncharacterized protein n=1 Tax=Pedobacter cryoconitis TaxID=188932 RepID=A0A7W8YPT8_9SPHI|nr:hypothetical protein [Pedobacter cryoconitis]MBB5619335.1 hypothetical protein [Pedobacter cryoconitis]